MGPHHALRPSRRAAGVQDERPPVGLPRRRCRSSLVGGGDLLGVEQRDAARPQDRFEQRPVLGGSDDRGHRGVVDHVLEFGCGVGETQRHGDPPGRPRAPLCGNEPKPRRRHDRHPGFVEVRGAVEEAPSDRCGAPHDIPVGVRPAVADDGEVGHRPPCPGKQCGAPHPASAVRHGGPPALTGSSASSGDRGPAGQRKAGGGGAHPCTGCMSRCSTLPSAWRANRRSSRSCTGLREAHGQPPNCVRR